MTYTSTDRGFFNRLVTWTPNMWVCMSIGQHSTWAFAHSTTWSNAWDVDKVKKNKSWGSIGLTFWRKILKCYSKTESRPVLSKSRSIPLETFGELGRHAEEYRRQDIKNNSSCPGEGRSKLHFIPNPTPLISQEGSAMMSYRPFFITMTNAKILILTCDYREP